MIEFSCRAADHDLFASVADTILMLDVEKWIRNLPSYDGTQADQDSMRLSPSEGVNITIDRYVMTAEGFMPKRDFGQYKIRKRIEVLKALSEEGKLFLAEVCK